MQPRACSGRRVSFWVSRFGFAPMVGTKMLSALDAMEQQALTELSTVLGGAALETFCVR